MANNNHESTMKWTVDISQFKPAMAEAERSIKLANSEFKKSVAGMDDWRKSTDGVNAKLKQLNDIAEAQRRKVQAVNEQYLEAVKAQGADSKEAQNLKIQLNNQEAQLAKTEKQIKQYTDGTINAGKATQGTSEHVTTFKIALGNLIAQGLQKTVGLFKDLYATFEDYDTGTDVIIKKTGAMGDTLDGFKDLYTKMSGEIVASQTDIGTAIGEVNTRFGSTGEELENLSTLFLKFAQLNNTDVGTAIDSVQKSLSAFGLSTDDTERVLDAMNATGQNTGVQMATLADGLVKNATAFQEMGLNVEQSVNFMGQLEKSGVNSETVLSGLNRALKNASKDGKPFNEALKELQESILASNGSISEASEVYDLFGKSGDQLFRAIRDGSVDFTKLSETTLESAGSVSKTYEATQDASDKVKLVIQNAKSEIGQIVGKLLEENKDKVQKAVKTISQFIKNFLNFIVKNGDKVTAVLKGLGTALLAIGASKLINGLKNVKNTMGDLFKLIVAHPYIALATAIGGVGVALVNLAKDSIKTKNAEYQLTEQEKELAEKVALNAEKWAELEEARTKAVNIANTDANYNQGLLDELNNIVDANGKIKQGYEERAQFIITTLNNAYGTELKAVDGVLNLTQETTKEIKKQIEAQRQQAILDAFKDEYLEALHNINSQEKDLYKAQLDYNREADKNNQLLEKKQKLENDLNSESNYNKRQEILQDLEDTNEKLNTSNGTLETVKGTLKNVKDAYANSKNTIYNYEEATGAVASGAQDATTKLDNLQGRVIKFGSEELATEVYNNAQKTGLNLLAGMQKGTETGWGKLRNYLIDVGRKTVEAINQGAQVHSPSRLTMLTGKYLDMGIEVGAEKRAQTTRHKLAYLGKSFAESMTTTKGLLNGASTGLNIPIGGVATTSNNSQVINFNQTINSPKAPDRLTIYRETNSLLFGAGVKLNGI